MSRLDRICSRLLDDIYHNEYYLDILKYRKNHSEAMRIEGRIRELSRNYGRIILRYHIKEPSLREKFDLIDEFFNKPTDQFNFW